MWTIPGSEDRGMVSLSRLAKLGKRWVDACFHRPIAVIANWRSPLAPLDLSSSTNLTYPTYSVISVGHWPFHMQSSSPLGARTGFCGILIGKLNGPAL